MQRLAPQSKILKAVWDSTAEQQPRAVWQGAVRDDFELILKHYGGVQQFLQQNLLHPTSVHEFFKTHELSSDDVTTWDRTTPIYGLGGVFKLSVADLSFHSASTTKPPSVCESIPCSS